MIKKIFVLPLIIIVLCSVHLHAKGPGKEAAARVKWQQDISSAPTTTEKFNRLGEKVVEDIRNSVVSIIDKNKWNKLRLKDRKINLLISFREIAKRDLKSLQEGKDVPLDKIFDPGDIDCLKLYAYDLLSGAIKHAIENDSRLSQYVNILSVETEILKEAIMETEDDIYNRSGRLKYGEMQALNANYYCSFKVLKTQKKFMFNRGHANLIEVGHAIGHTANFELEAGDLFDECERISSTGAFNFKSYWPPDAGKVETLEKPVIYYQADEMSGWTTIKTGDTVRSNGKISFAIKLPDPTGYLLVFLRDSQGRFFNLFPGTGKALENKQYRVPDSLDSPATEVLRDTAIGTRKEFKKLDSGNIQTAVYTFDDNPGVETFYFYFSDRPNPGLENFLSRARDTGDNLPEIKTKGVKSLSESFSGKATLFHNILQLDIKHK